MQSKTVSLRHNRRQGIPKPSQEQSANVFVEMMKICSRKSDYFPPSTLLLATELFLW